VTDAELGQHRGHEHSPVILLVEDEIFIRFLTAEVLRDEGYVVLEAVNAAEALTIFNTGYPFDLVITDIRMPGDIDGTALALALKEAIPDLPVAFLSATIPPEKVHAADAFISKPFLPSELLKLVRELIGPKWRSRRDNRSAS